MALALAGGYQPTSAENVALEIGLPCYARPRGDRVALTLAGDYQPPAGDAVALRVLCDVFKLPCYSVPAGDAVALDLVGDYAPPPGDAVALKLQCDIPLPPQPDPEPEPDPGYIFDGLTTSARVTWATRVRTSLRTLTTATWRQGGRRNAAPRVRWGAANPSNVHMRFGWAKVPQRDTSTRFAWRGLSGITLRHAARTAWQFTPPKDGRSRIAWGTLPTPVAVFAGVGYSNPPAKDWQARVSWGGEPEPLRAELGAVWLDSLTKDSVDYRIPWSHLDGTRYVFVEPEPGPPPEPPPPAFDPCYFPPDGDQVALAMGGLYLRPNADQIPLNLTCITRTLFARRSFIMSHTLSVVRLPDREPIDVTALRIEVDEESWAWSFQLEIGPRAHYHLLLPTVTENQEIEIALDGYVWTALVEDPSESRAVGQKTRFSCRARSRTALLAAPYAAERSYTSESDMSAAQLADRELDLTGFTLDWQGPTWTVPAGAWSYSSLTPMGAITRIAEAAGCYVLSDMADKIVHVLPRYPTPPWDWSNATPDVQLQSGAATALSTRRLPGPKYHGVYISGETQGVLTEIKRDGTSGAPYAEMVVDPLSTATAPAIPRGTGVIADSQDRKEQPLALPFGVGVGPIKPAELVEVQDTVFGTYRARSVAAAITCELRDNAMSVRQQVTLHQHHDDLGA
ncbi:hypothetical protein [Algiphilus sp.]|uniref:hypothetical protein n=1 Tax=Algiphilus sp. TaxID=1872431 RepID=UPI0032EAC6D4